MAMRKNIIWMAFAAIAAISLMAGCNKEKMEEDALTNEPGTEIVFGASTDWLNDEQTRTEYSGKDEQNGTVHKTSEYERIDWVNGKDVIRILCEQAVPKTGTSPMASYVVNNVRIDNSDRKKSLAGIVPVDNSLIWGTGTHYFYALYPAPGMDSNYNFSDKTVSSSNSKIEAVSNNRAKITGVIPATQNAVKSGNIYKANMNYAYMYATTKATAGQSGKVMLSFNPLVTTLEFYLTQVAADASTANLTRLELSSTSTPLTGTFTATINGTGSTPTASISAPAYSTSNNKITITLPGNGVRLSNTPITVTFLTLPVQQKNLTLTLYFGSNYAIKRTLKLNSTSGPVSVGACTKAYFHFGVPDTMYYIDAEGPVVMGDNGNSDELILGGKRTIKINSYKRHTSNSTAAVSWKVYASTDNGAHYYSHGQSGWPEWLELSAYSGPGSVSNANLTAKIGYNPRVTGTVSDVATAGNGANMIRTIRNATVVTGPRDLSLYNIYGQLHGPSTAPAGITKAGAHSANSYVVSAPGTYCFPIVYGNAIDKTHGDANGVYAAAYGADHTTRFHNASGVNLSSAYILSDPSLEKSGNYEAVVVWQDVHTGWAMLTDADVSIIDAPSGAGVPGCKYIKFYLDKNKILPGNFTIALRDTGLNRILWSWHIWVTAVPHSAASDDFTIRTYKYRTKIYEPESSGGGVPAGNNPPAGSTLENTSMLNCNLGWTPPLDYTVAETAQRTAILKFVQDEGTPNALYDEVVVRQDKVTIPAYHGIYYSNTHYEWGRKDPFLPERGSSDAANKSHQDGETFSGKIVNGNTLLFRGDLGQNPGALIRNPHEYDTAPSSTVGNGMHYLWNEKYIAGNIMDVKETVVIKTVYDPCPAGFTVPFGYAFTAFTRDGYHREAATLVPSHQADFFGKEIATDAAKAHPGGFMMTATGLQNESDYTLYFAYTGHRVMGNCGGAEEQAYIWTCCDYPGYRETNGESWKDNGQCLGLHHNIFPLFNAYNRRHGFSVRPMVEQ